MTQDEVYNNRWNKPGRSVVYHRYFLSLLEVSSLFAVWSFVVFVKLWARLKPSPSQSSGLSSLVLTVAQ